MALLNIPDQTHRSVSRSISVFTDALDLENLEHIKELESNRPNLNQEFIKTTGTSYFMKPKFKNGGLEKIKAQFNNKRFDRMTTQHALDDCEVDRFIVRSRNHRIELSEMD